MTGLEVPILLLVVAAVISWVNIDSQKGWERMYQMLLKRRDEAVGYFKEFNAAVSVIQYLPAPKQDNVEEWHSALVGLEAAVRNVESMSKPIFNGEPVVERSWTDNGKSVVENVWMVPRKLLEAYRAYAGGHLSPSVRATIEAYDDHVIQEMIKLQLQEMTVYARSPATGGKLESPRKFQLPMVGKRLEVAKALNGRLETTPISAPLETEPGALPATINQQQQDLLNENEMA